VPLIDQVALEGDRAAVQILLLCHRWVPMPIATTILCRAIDHLVAHHPHLLLSPPRGGSSVPFDGVRI
jgi:hypothetical protein